MSLQNMVAGALESLLSRGFGAAFGFSRGEIVMTCGPIVVASSSSEQQQHVQQRAAARAAAASNEQQLEQQHELTLASGRTTPPQSCS